MTDAELERLAIERVLSSRYEAIDRALREAIAKGYRGRLYAWSEYRDGIFTHIVSATAPSPGTCFGCLVYEINDDNAKVAEPYLQNVKP